MYRGYAITVFVIKTASSTTTLHYCIIAYMHDCGGGGGGGGGGACIKWKSRSLIERVVYTKKI